MRKLESLKQAAVGEIVSFVYFGGGTPTGGIRTVEVTDKNDDRIFGVDTSIDEPRQYLYSLALQAHVTYERTTVPVAEAACDCQVSPVVPQGMRHITEEISFQDVVAQLKRQVDEMTIEELAEVAREFGCADTVDSDCYTGMITLGKYKPEPKFTVGHSDVENTLGLFVANQEGQQIAITINGMPDPIVRVNGEAVTPDGLASKLISHLAY